MNFRHFRQGGVHGDHIDEENKRIERGAWTHQKAK